MPTAFEEVTLGYKIAGLAFEISRSAANQFKSWKDKSNHRILSSLTTLEFIQQGSDVISYFVQDRTAKITKDDVFMPPFSYGTQGHDDFGNISIANGENHNHYKPKILEKEGNAKVVGIDEQILFARNTVLRCVLTVTSKNGFPKTQENFSYSVENWTEAATVFIIFPESRPPKELQVKFRKKQDAKGQWRSITQEKNELRQFTGGRKAFILEAKNPPIGHKYKISWEW